MCYYNLGIAKAYYFSKQKLYNISRFFINIAYFNEINTVTEIIVLANAFNTNIVIDLEKMNILKFLE